MRWTWLILFCAAGALQAQPTVDEALKEAVGRLQSQYLEALKNRDADAFVALFAEDAMVLTPGAPLLQGRDTIRRDREAVFARAEILSGVSRTHHLEQSGDLAYEVGRFSYTIRVDDNPPRIVEGKYLTIWKRDAAGQWHYQVDAGLPD